ncbi:MAG: sensor histidine kinase [Magnetococcales bacterium]|nr:sensor histidine kinase [Magnetococcales bacterium]NGZ27850.1 sensor histidine kinase [Magnetococcales bacterium]
MTRPTTDNTRSLTSRLVLASLVWIILALSASGFFLVYLFQDALERRFLQELDDHLVELVAASDLFEDEAIRLIWTPADSRFQLPFSGWYWEVVAGKRTLLRSRSLMGKSLLHQDSSLNEEGQSFTRQQGPDGSMIVVSSQFIRFPERDDPLLYLIAGPAEVVEKEIRTFTSLLMGMLAVLGVGLMAGVVWQVQYGLRPLNYVRQELTAIRQGEQGRLSDNFPGEVIPLVWEINALLAYQSAFLERVRSQSGDLAHALKNPLAILRNEAADLSGEKGERIQRGLASVATILEDRLARARLGGTGNLLSARSDVHGVVVSLCMALSQLHRDKGVQFTVEGLEGLAFRGDEQDLEEMLGNLLDNACKWCQSRVAIMGRQIDHRLELTIHDDGPGVAENQRHLLMKRGQRLDETVPGSGLGLSIVANTLSLYQGEIRLEGGPWGGLQVVVYLPAV